LIRHPLSQRLPIPSATFQQQLRLLQKKKTKKRSSDISLYDDNWSIFTSWDEEHGISPFNPFSLIWLNSYIFCTIKGLNPQTVKGYGTTLSAYLIPLDVFWGNSVARWSLLLLDIHYPYLGLRCCHVNIKVRYFWTFRFRSVKGIDL
jgi:hypothetical protein